MVDVSDQHNGQHWKLWLHGLADLRVSVRGICGVFAALSFGLWLTGFLGGAAFVILLAVCLFITLLAEPAKARRIAEAETFSASSEKHQYTILLDALADPIILLDRDGIVQFSNRAAQKQLGSLTEGVNARLRFRAPEISEMLLSAFNGGRPAPVEMLERQTPENWYSVSIVPLEDVPPFAFLMRFVDLTEQRKQERVRSAFVANASHELRTPLASLSGFIETLKGPAKNDELARQRFLDIMHQQTGRMSRLVDDLLALSRFETARGVSEFSPQNLGDAINHVIDAVRPLAEKEGLAIGLSVDKDLHQPIVVNGSRDELIQLFSNLGENAVKYGADGESVEIVLTPDTIHNAPAVRVTVRDHGMGIEPRHIPRLTERFYRVDEEESRVKQGTGLGLAIVKHITTRHGGRLQIESVPGEGASFHITLPLM